MIQLLSNKKASMLVAICISILLSAWNVQAQSVSVKGRQIYVNEKAYTIKGICYHPVPRGSDDRSFASLQQDLDLMKEAGINTIRVYAPIMDEKVLDQIYHAGIRVIMGFGYDQDGQHDILSGTFINYVDRFKNHEAILMWELGNEYNYHPKWFKGDIKNWYKALNKAAQLIHQHDTQHPVTTAHGELPDSTALAICTDVDVWGMNIYRWDNPGNLYEQWEQASNKPMYLSEAGADSYMSIAKSGYKAGENEKAQADALKKILHSIFNHQQICSGVCVFSFLDGIWKAGNNQQYDKGGWAPNSSGVPYDGAPNEEYWGILNIERNKKQAFSVLQQKYQEVK